MLKLVVRISLVLRIVLSIHTPHSSEPANSLTLESCNYGDTIESLCNKCVCTSNGIYDCEPKDCLPTVPEVNYDTDKTCHPNTVYNQGSTSCVCTARGQWPHKTCHDTFKYLPETSITKKTCEPNGYFRVGCNVCRCNSNGEVDIKRCTLNECDGKPTVRKNNQHTSSNIFGTCLVENWYSLAPCQFCYCMDTNKLICSTSLINAQKENKMMLGKSDLVLCGPGLLREVAALVPSSKSSQISRLLPTDFKLSKATEETSKQTIEHDDDKNKVKYHLSFTQGLKADKIKEDIDDSGEDIAIQFKQRSGAVKKGIKTKQNIEDDDDENKLKDKLFTQGLKADKIKEYIEDSDEDIAIQIKQRSGAVKKRIKTNDETRNLAASIDDDANPSILSQKLRTFSIEALRKILSNRRGLKLDSGNKCKPGSAITVECNICHCLKNGKLLCSDRKC